MSSKSKDKGKAPQSAAITNPQNPQNTPKLMASAISSAKPITCEVVPGEKTTTPPTIQSEKVQNLVDILSKSPELLLALQTLSLESSQENKSSQSEMQKEKRKQSKDEENDSSSRKRRKTGPSKPVSFVSTEPLIKMAGPNYQFWECVEKMDAGRAVCKFCDLEFGKGTTITRIKSHLSGVKGLGIRTCDNAPGEIKDAARAALDRKVSTRMPTGEDLVGAQETTGEATQTEDQVHHLVDNSWDVIAAAAHLMDTRGDPLPTSSTMLKGGAFVENTRTIWSWIMDDEISSIGIYGMGLVGKTEMLKHIHNELLQSQDICHRLYWVTVPQEDFSIETLQNLIAKRLDLVLSSEDDIMHRAAKLSKELTNKQKWILILDDLWDDFEPHVLGIPVSLEGCKLIVSTRSEEICLKVTDRSVRVNPLSNEEALELFMKKLGHNIELPLEKRRIAECIVKECGGLPLAIIAMAGSMKRMGFNRQWRDALQDLEQSTAGQSHMEKADHEERPLI